MANIQGINGVWTALTATATTSGVAVTISGVREDERAAFVYITDTGEIEGTLSLSAGGYSNGVAKTIEASGIYAMANVDGSTSRQSDGTYIVTPHNAGNLYTFKTPRGVA